MPWVKGKFVRYRYMFLRSDKVGVVMVDLHERRLKKMAERLSEWGQIIELYRQSEKVRVVSLGLTYMPSVEWEKNHIQRYLQITRNRLQERLKAWCWVAEIQPGTGRMHYHVLLVVLPGSNIPKPDVNDWPHGMSNIYEVRKGSGVSYLLKYAGKSGEQKPVQGYPKGAHMFGSSLRGVGDDLRAYAAMIRQSGSLETDSVVRESHRWMYLGSSVTENYGRKFIGNLS